MRKYFFLIYFFPSLLFSESTLSLVNDKISSLLFFDISFGFFNEQKIPLIVFWLVLGLFLFTVIFKFINIRAFKHSIDVIRGKYDNPNDEGDISHFKALSSALSGTIGLGNIAGVAIAIQIGGPGAVVWMIFMAFFSMSAKFCSATLGQLYRKVNFDGSISGGPMYYIDLGLKDFNPKLRFISKTLACFYAIAIIGSCFGAAGMFQVNQIVESLNQSVHISSEHNLKLGIFIAFLVGIVIIGGVKRIAEITSKVVPLMCIIYFVAAVVVVTVNFSKLPEAISLMFKMAFFDNAALGGFIGVIITGVQRAAFSNEGGLGSASIIHAAAKTDEPVREGIVAMIGPVIDTMIICFLTSLVIIVSGVWQTPAEGLQGVTLTSNAFATVIPWFPYVLTVCIFLFAYSSIISWSYYGERAWDYIVNHFNIKFKSIIIFRVLLIISILIGAVQPLKDVVDFMDLMILSLAFPNIIACLILSPKISKLLKEYLIKLKDGKFKIYK